MLGIYLKALAIVYAYGAAVHTANLLGFGPARPPAVRVLWIAADLVFLPLDVAAAIGLWLGRRWGVALFLLAAAAQLVMYLGFPQSFASGPEQAGALGQLVVFHLVTVAGWLLLAGIERARA